MIHGRPLVDVGHCGDVDGDAVFVLTTENPNMIDEEDFGDDDDEDNDENDDDLEILEEIRDRIACEEGREWTEISATSESLTVACETCGVGGVGTGCLVRVIAWGLDGAEHHTTTWLPNVTLELLQRVPEGPT